MLLLKRLATAFVLFCILFVAFFVGTLMVGGGIAGARAGQQYQGPKDFHTGFEIGQRAGREFSQKYGLIILLGSFCGAGATSLALSFSGIFPWCRKNPEPPK